MPFSKERVAQIQHDTPLIGRQLEISTCGGYLRLHLAYEGAPKSQKVIEYAHRLILWTMFGPPPSSLGICMHYCNNK